MTKQQITTRHSKDDLMGKLVLYIACPFASFLMSLRDASSKSSYVIYWLFGIIFCWNLAPNHNAIYDDLIGIIERFNSTVITWDYLVDQTALYFTFSGAGEKELYEIFLNWLTRCFSDNYHLFFAFASIGYLAFAMRSLKYITDDRKFDNSFMCLVVLALFMMPRDIITVQNPRYCTAMWCWLLGILRYFLDDRKNIRGLILIAISPLFHSGLWISVGIFVVGLIMCRYPKYCKVLFYVSIPFSFIVYDAYSILSPDMLPIPENFRVWLNDHFSDESYNNLANHVGASGFFWVGLAFQYLMKFAYIVVIVKMIRERNEMNYENGLNGKFFNFLIFFFAVVNFLQSVPVINERSYVALRIFVALLWFKMMYPRYKNYLIFLLIGCSWFIFQRYFYNGAVNSSVPYGIFYEPLPLLIFDGL